MSEAEDGDPPKAVGAFPTKSAPQRKGSRGRAILNESFNESPPASSSDEPEQARAPEELLFRAREDQQQEPASPTPAGVGAFPSTGRPNRTKRRSIHAVDTNTTDLVGFRRASTLGALRGSLRNSRGRQGYGGGGGPTAHNPHEPHREPQNLVASEPPTSGAERLRRTLSDPSSRRAYLERRKSGELPSHATNRLPRRTLSGPGEPSARRRSRLERRKSGELPTVGSDRLRRTLSGSRELSARRSYLERKKSGELPSPRGLRPPTHEPRTSIVRSHGSIRTRSSPAAPSLTMDASDEPEVSQPNSSRSRTDANEQDMRNTQPQSSADNDIDGDEDKSFAKAILQLTDSEGENEEAARGTYPDIDTTLQQTSIHTVPEVSVELDIHVDGEDDTFEPAQQHRGISTEENPVTDAVDILASTYSGIPRPDPINFETTAYVVEETERDRNDIDEQQQPLIVAATQVDTGKQRRRMVLVAVVALIIGGLVATVAILLASRDSSPNDPDTTLVPTMSPSLRSESTLVPSITTAASPLTNTSAATESPTNNNHSNIFDHPTVATSTDTTSTDTTNSTEPTVAPAARFPIPDYTMDALHDALSPQSLALIWLEEHPNYNTMPVWRLQQLFALGTFAFSTMATEQAQLWLDHDTEECMWPQPEDGESTGPNCTDEGQYQVLNFQSRIERQLEEASTSRLRGTVPPEISLLSMLYSIELIQQELVGKIPQQIYQLTKLQTLNVQDNGRLSGNLLGHPDIGKLMELKSLVAGGNRLSGSLATEVGLLSKLVSLSMSNGNLKGSLPSELGLTTLIEKLSLDNNQFTGTLTTEIGQLSRLKELSLAHNNLQGLVTQELGQLTDLIEINLRGNSFSGTIPSQICSAERLEVDCTVECKCQSCTCYDFSPPSYSQNALQDTTSPQSAALAWLEDHPEFSQMKKWRKEQLFALATFAHSTMTTDQAQLWLNHNTEECKWPQPDHKIRDGPDCTEDGMYQALSFTIEDGEQLEVFQNRLEGTIPPQIALLSLLHTLNVWNQVITGTLPTEMYSLTTLQYLHMGSSGKLSGSFLSHPDIGQMTSLQHLEIENQNLRGALATELGMISEIFFLGVGGNNFHSKLPSELGQLTSLENLFLGSNQLTGPIPQEYYNLTKLDFLDLNSNKLTGTLSADVGSLTKLTSLHLEFNDMEGTLPFKGLAPLGELLGLYLQGNRFSGAIPQPVCADANEVKVDCNVICNCMTCSCPDELFTPPNYSRDALRNSSSPQSLALAWLQNHPQYVEMPPWRREQLFALSTFAYSAMTMDQALMWLDPNTTECDWPQPQPQREPVRLGIGPDCTNGHYQTLSFRIEEGPEKLDVFQRKLQGTIPPEVALLSLLKTLNFWDQPISGEIPPQLTMMTQLEFINMGTSADLSGNLLSNPEIAQLSNLEYLWLGDHSLTGTLASELGMLSKLSVFHGGISKLKGTLPSEVGQLTKLTQIQLQRNDFTGPIPKEYYGLTDLIVFELSYNQLTGSLMPELGQLSKLTSLHLESNKLEGALPKELRQLTDLLDLNLQYNTFSGTVPETICSESPTNADCSVVCRCDKCSCFSWPGLECTCEEDSR